MSPNLGGWGFAGSQPIGTQINFGDLTPYVKYLSHLLIDQFIFLLKKHSGKCANFNPILMSSFHYQELCFNNGVTPLSDAPAYEKPGKPVNVTVVAVNGGWVIR
jgi:hypothetical protein